MLRSILLRAAFGFSLGTPLTGVAIWCTPAGKVHSTYLLELLFAQLFVQQMLFVYWRWCRLKEITK